MRLGTKSINYKASATRPGLTITPALKFWRARGHKAAAASTLAILAWIFYLLFSTPRFFVYGADIQGNVAVSDREIYAVSGIENQSIFWLSAAQIADKIMTLPNIKSASVSIALPARVTIQVVERRPELLWQTGDTVWWVDQEGVIVPPKTEDTAGMLRIIDDDRRPVEAGYQIDPSLIEGAQTLRILAPDVSVIRYTRSQGLTVATPEGWPVYLGDGSQVKAKLVVLTALLADLRQRNVSPAFIDVRNPLRPVYRPNTIIRIGQPAPAPAAPPGR